MRMDEYVAPAPEQNPPYICLPLPLATKIEGIEPGMRVKVVLEADVTKIVKRDVDEAEVFGGSATELGLEVYKAGVSVVDAEVEELMDD